MQPDQKRRILDGLSDILGRLHALRDQPIAPLPQWPNVRTWIEDAHRIFKKTIDAFIVPCEAYQKQLNSRRVDALAFDEWKSRLADLWIRVDFLRGVHNRLFSHDYTVMIYHHLLIEEMFACFPAEAPSAAFRTKFLLLPSGELVVWPLNKSLGKLGAPYFDEKFLDAFDEIYSCETLTCFECHREQDFLRQAVLAHEIFHIVVASNSSLFMMLDKVSAENKVIDLLPPHTPKSVRSQVEELFCDFAASWFYGPVFLKAFVDELYYYNVQGSITHPASDVRAAFMLACHSKAKNHKAFPALAQYLEVRKREGIELPKAQDFELIRSEFEKALKVIGLPKYKYEQDKDSKISKSFDQNIPFVSRDIRFFLNNLPERPPKMPEDRYRDLVCESLRKTNILRQVSEFVREPDSLFSAAPALGYTGK